MSDEVKAQLEAQFKQHKEKSAMPPPAQVPAKEVRPQGRPQGMEENTQ